jgi:hypothetical protein
VRGDDRARRAWTTQERFCYTHDSHVGDLVIWDNDKSAGSEQLGVLIAPAVSWSTVRYSLLMLRSNFS